MNPLRKLKSLTYRPSAEFWHALIEVHGKWNLKSLVDGHVHDDRCNCYEFLDALHVVDRWMDIAIDEGWTE